MVVGYGKSIVLGKFSAITSSDKKQNPSDLLVIDDKQIVRAVGFIQIPSGPVCLVSAGDGKMINLYNVSSAEDCKSQNIKITAPCYTYGPHTKRITHLVTCSEGIIVFADKFGEVYRLQLSWSPNHTVVPEGSASAPTSFLLQHFSIFSCLFLSAPIPRHEGIGSTEERSNSLCRRLFTCDKDCHVRSSQFPETFAIEQYLWANTGSPAVVTAIAEIPPVEFQRTCHIKKETASGGLDLCNSLKGSEGTLCQLPMLSSQSFYALGYVNGLVSFWMAKNTLQRGERCDVFSLCGQFVPSFAEVGDKNKPAGQKKVGVVGLCFVAASIDLQGFPKHPQDTARGVFVGYEGQKEVFFVPLLSDESGMLRTITNKVVSVALPHAVVALRRCTANSAVALTQEGTIHFVELLSSSSVEKSKDVASMKWEIQVRKEWSMKAMEASLQKVCAGGLATLDLWAEWEKEVVDPRKRVRDEDSKPKKSKKNQSDKSDSSDAEV